MVGVLAAANEKAEFSLSEILRLVHVDLVNDPLVALVTAHPATTTTTDIATTEGHKYNSQLLFFLV